MPVYNVTSVFRVYGKKERHPLTLIIVDDSSPLFTFAGAWTDVVDERAHGSYNDTLHSTSDRVSPGSVPAQHNFLHCHSTIEPSECYGHFELSRNGH
jgi:hypothetical protein